MEVLQDIIAFVTANGPMLIDNIGIILVALIAICAVIPGEQPQKTLQAIVDFIKKWSRK